jgi:YfiH family protein
LKIKSKKIIFDEINHCFFDRRNGNSSSLYSSLNGSKFVGDEESLVRQNLDIVKKDLAADKIITLNQIHSNLCVIADENTEADLKADALVTQASRIAIGILTADCAPILLCDPLNHIVGAAHAGWRGAVGGILATTVQKMKELGSDPSKIFAAIGPCILKQSYEVDDNFRNNFTNDDDDCFCIIDQRLHFDLPKYCCNRLLELEIPESNIDLLNVDTYSNQEDYFSYRFANQHTNGICGRNISAICLGK